MELPLHDAVQVGWKACHLLVRQQKDIVKHNPNHPSDMVKLSFPEDRHLTDYLSVHNEDTMQPHSDARCTSCAMRACGYPTRGLGMIEASKL